MSDRYTSKDVRRAYEYLVDRLDELGLDTSRAYLTISRDGGPGGPFVQVGNLPGIPPFATRGMRNAYDSLTFATSVLRAVRWHGRGVE